MITVILIEQRIISRIIIRYSLFCSSNMSAFKMFLGILFFSQLKYDNVFATENNFYPFIFGNAASVNDDTCVTVINEQPCLKNLLNLLGKEIINLKGELRKQHEKYTKDSSEHFENLLS